MRRSLLLASSILLVTVALFSTAVAGNTGKGYTAIDSCTYIGEPGKYQLSNDIAACVLEEGGFLSTGVTIDANDVVLDLKGYSITCNGSGYFNFGVLIASDASKVSVKNGSVSGCDPGVVMVTNTDSSLKKMTISGNGVGIRMYGGSRNTISRNRITENYGDGILLGAFDVQGNLVGSTNHKVRKNLITHNGNFGISTNSTENSEFACNRTDYNIVGIGLSALATGNIVNKNVANYNWDAGISAFGYIGLGPDVGVAAGNTFKHNSAMSNGRVDLSEVTVDFTQEGAPLIAGPKCLNVWKKNQFGLEMGPMDCIGTSKIFDDDGCAPEHDFDDDDDSDDG